MSISACPLFVSRENRMKRTMIFDVPRSVVEKAIDEWCFNELYRDVLKRRFLDGVTFERLSEEFDMSVRQIQNIVYKEGDRVLLHIK